MLYKVKSKSYFSKITQSFALPNIALVRDCFPPSTASVRYRLPAVISFKFLSVPPLLCRSQLPRDLRRGSSAASLLKLWVRIPSGAWMFICCECCVFRYRSFRRTDHSSREVLPTVVCRCVWSRNFESEEAKARYRAVKIQPQWVVKPRKQTNHPSYLSLTVSGHTLPD